MSPVWTDGKLNDLLKYQALFSVSWTPSIIQKKLGCAKIVRVFVSWNWLFIDCCTDEGALGHYFLLLLLFVLFCFVEFTVYSFKTVFSRLMFIVWFDTQKDRQEAGQVPPVSNPVAWLQWLCIRDYFYSCCGLLLHPLFQKFVSKTSTNQNIFHAVQVALHAAPRLCERRAAKHQMLQSCHVFQP